jgi:hypothetical protein
MNIPLPFIYLTENKKGELVVVDGRQRLTTLFDYLNDKFTLGKRLKILDKIKNKKFSQLEPVQQGIIEDYQLLSHIIKPPTSDRVMIDIFDRVNRGGTKLNNQEIRNALYQGQSTKLIKEISESKEFIKATNESIKPERMKDKYIILRAIVFYLWKKNFDINVKTNIVYIDYTGNTEDFLGKYMEIINLYSDEKIEILKRKILDAINNSYYLLGPDAFRLPSKKNSFLKRPISMALFEVLVYFFIEISKHENKDIFIGKYKDLLVSEEFLNSFLSIDSNLKYRFNKIDEIINYMPNA